jgi:hypothetical protein
MAAVCSGGIYTGFASVGYAKVAVLGVVQGLTKLLPILLDGPYALGACVVWVAGPQFSVLGHHAIGCACCGRELLLEGRRSSGERSNLSRNRETLEHA